MNPDQETSRHHIPPLIKLSTQPNLNPTPTIMTRYRSFLLAGCIATLSSCATEAPRGPVGNFSVKVVPFFGKDVRVYITAYPRDPQGQRGPDVVNRRVTGDGITGFVLPAGRVYGVRAYADLDGDGRSGPADPTASMEGLKPVTDLSANQDPVVLTLPGTGAAPDWPQKKNVSASQTGTPGTDDIQKGIDTLRAAAPGTLPGSINAGNVQKAADKLREAAPGLPIPPLPVPPPPK